MRIFCVIGIWRKLLLSNEIISKILMNSCGYFFVGKSVGKTGISRSIMKNQWTGDTIKTQKLHRRN